MENNNKYLKVDERYLDGTIYDERYLNGKIYKVVDNGNNLCYIGSTKDPLEVRFKNHISKYKQYLRGKCTGDSICSIFDTYGYENCKIELVKLFPCNNRYLLEYEEGYEQSLTICVNKNRAGNFRKMGRKYYKAKYEIKNAQSLKIYRQQYYLKHKERMNKGDKERRLKKKLTKLEIEFEELSK